MGGIINDILIVDNVNFDPTSGPPFTGQITTDGELLIGSTAAPYLRTGTLTSNDASVAITYSAPNINLAVNGSAFGQTITGQSGPPLSPTDGNWNIYGLGEMNTSGASSTLSILQPRVNKFIVDPVTNYGTHQTITGATAAASAGDVIFIRPGVYIENFTPKPRVTYSAFGTSSQSGPVVIRGKLSDGGVGSGVSFFGISFETNGDFSFDLTSNSVWQTFNCSLEGVDNTLLSLGSDAIIYMQYSYTNLRTNGIKLFESTGGQLYATYSWLDNEFGSATASTIVGGTAFFDHCKIYFPISASSNSNLRISNSQFDLSDLNATCITTAGTATALIENSQLLSGTASTISVGVGTVVTATNISANSSNSFVLTGAGEIRHGSIVFNGSSSGHNVSIETALTVF